MSPRGASAPGFGTRAALAAIRGYQLWISPHKGFSCALRAATGAESCSAYGHRVIARFGLRRGLGLLQRRLDLCGHVHRSTPAPRPPPLPPWLRKQQGYCDCDVPCFDLPSCDLPCHGSGGHNALLDSVCDLLECADCGCDVFDQSRKRRERRTRLQQDALAQRLRRQRMER